MNLPGNAALSALGGVNVSSFNQNVNFFQSNPALIGDTTNGWGSASYMFYFANIGMANFSYQHKFDKIGSLSFGIQHVAYGTIQGYDPLGVATSKFNSGESALFIGKSHRINHFTVGANLKGAFSNIAGYRSSALLLDLGGVFVHPRQDLKIGVVIKNLGVVLSEFSNTSTTRLPFDLQAGVTFRPEHMPVRFSFTAHHLTGFDISYYNINDGGEKPNVLDKALRHLNVGAELLIHKNVNLLVGYNFLRHKELKLDNSGGGSGFSAGVAMRIRNIDLVVSRAGYATGGSYQISLAANIGKMIAGK